MKKMIMKRLKNPLFYMAVGALFFTATGIVPEDLTSWAVLGDKIVELFASPFLLGTFVVSFIGQFVSLDTKGLTDKNRK